MYGKPKSKPVLIEKRLEIEYIKNNFFLAESEEWH